VQADGTETESSECSDTILLSKDDKTPGYMTLERLSEYISNMSLLYPSSEPYIIT